MTPAPPSCSKTEEKAEAAALHIGDRVRVLSLNLEGTVSTLPNPKGDLFVQMGILRSQVNINDLEYIGEAENLQKGMTTGGGSFGCPSQQRSAPRSI